MSRSVACIPWSTCTLGDMDRAMNAATRAAVRSGIGTIAIVLQLLTAVPARAQDERLTVGVGAGGFVYRHHVGGSDAYASGPAFTPIGSVSLGVRLGKRTELHTRLVFSPLTLWDDIFLGAALGGSFEVWRGTYGWADLGVMHTAHLDGTPRANQLMTMSGALGFGYAFSGVHLRPGFWISVGATVVDFGNLIQGISKDPVLGSVAGMVTAGYDFWFW